MQCLRMALCRCTGRCAATRRAGHDEDRARHQFNELEYQYAGRYPQTRDGWWLLNTFFNMPQWLARHKS